MAKEEASKELVVRDEFPVIGQDLSSLREIIEINMDGETTYPSDLFNMVKVPSGGSKMWTIETMEGETETKEIKGIIIHIGHERALYEGAFEDPESSNVPICASRDGITGIGNPGGDCATCEKAQFGPNGEKKECGEMKPAYVLFPGEANLPTIIRISPGSFKNLKKYRLKLMNHNKRLFDVVTSFTLSKEKNSGNIDYSMVNFAIDSVIQDKETRDMIESYRKNIMPFINPEQEKKAA